MSFGDYAPSQMPFSFGGALSVPRAAVRNGHLS